MFKFEYTLIPGFFAMYVIQVVTTVTEANGSVVNDRLNVSVRSNLEGASRSAWGLSMNTFHDLHFGVVRSFVTCNTGTVD
jgi:hypothetical protein